MILLPEEEKKPRKKIFWISSVIIDLFLYKKAEMGMLKHLAECGYDVYFFGGKSKKSVQEDDSSIHLILIPLRYMPIMTSILLALMVFILMPFYIVGKKPDFIIFEPGPTIISFIWKPLLYPSRTKVFLDVRSTPVILEARDARLRGLLSALWFNISIIVSKKIFDGMTIITAPMKKEICDRFHNDPKSIGVWTSGVSTTLFNPEKYQGLEVRKKFGLIGRFIIFYHGDFGFHRGIIESIASIEKLKNKYDDIVLFLLGNGPALLVLQELIRKRVQGRVIIHDAVDYTDVPKYIAMCDVGIVPLPDLPDWRNQCPLKLLEYLAMKKVAIVTDIPANRDIIGDSRCGIYVSSVDPKEIANAIEYAYDNKEKLTEWGDYGRTLIEEKYDWKKVARDFENYILNC